MNTLGRTGLSEAQIKLIFIIPTIVVLVFILIYPIIWSIYLSFFDYRVIMKTPARFVGLRNYSEILTNPVMWQHMQVTGKFVFLAVFFELIIGFGVALLLNREFKGKGLITTLMLTPMMVCPVVIAIFWRFLLDPSFGVQNYITRVFFNYTIPWLSSPKWAIWAMVLVDTWMWSPFMMLISLAGLSAIPKYLYEAAEIDRASSWFKFTHITLPLVSPLLMIALLLRTIDCFKLFDLVFGLTGGGPADSTSTIAFEIYKTAFMKFYTGKSCALAYILFVIIVALSNIFIRFLNRLKT